MKITRITLTLELGIHDKQEFREHAAHIANRDVGPDEAARYLNPEDTDLANCAEMIFDSGRSLPGCDISKSKAQETTKTTTPHGL